MKLFQKLLLTPVALGFFSPIAASASEANLMDVSSYSQVDVEVTQDTFKPLSKKNPLLAGGEGLGQDLVSDFDGDTFSSTTSASFASNWAIGSIDGTANEKITNVVRKYKPLTEQTGNKLILFLIADDEHKFNREWAKLCRGEIEPSDEIDRKWLEADTAVLEKIIYGTEIANVLDS